MTSGWESSSAHISRRQPAANVVPQSVKNAPRQLGARCSPSAKNQSWLLPLLRLSSLQTRVSGKAWCGDAGWLATWYSPPLSTQCWKQTVSFRPLLDSGHSLRRKVGQRERGVLGVSASRYDM